MIELEEIALRHVKQGNESFVVEKPGHYYLCSASVANHLAITYAGTGTFMIYDAEIEEREGKKFYSPMKAHKVFLTNPIQVGAYHPSAGIKHGLVIHMSGGGMKIPGIVNFYFHPLRSPE
jgi:hypothetical protein